MQKIFTTFVNEINKTLEEIERINRAHQNHFKAGSTNLIDPLNSTCWSVKDEINFLAKNIGTLSKLKLENNILFIISVFINFHIIKNTRNSNQIKTFNHDFIQIALCAKDIEKKGISDYNIESILNDYLPFLSEIFAIDFDKIYKEYYDKVNLAINELKVDFEQNNLPFIRSIDFVGLGNSIKFFLILKDLSIKDAFDAELSELKESKPYNKPKSKPLQDAIAELRSKIFDNNEFETLSLTPTEIYKIKYALSKTFAKFSAEFIFHDLMECFTFNEYNQNGISKVIYEIFQKTVSQHLPGFINKEERFNTRKVQTDKLIDKNDFKKYQTRQLIKYINFPKK
ncbi:MAG: hypothetical protein AB7S69_12535 [Salinivirgaceae bacterium]